MYSSIYVVEISFPALSNRSSGSLDMYGSVLNLCMALASTSDQTFHDLQFHAFQGFPPSNAKIVRQASKVSDDLVETVRAYSSISYL
jgi:hypothetical protein